eukprot:scaffold301_cov243-Pinguiococcus_pyrenoidosus.AAC.146
MEKKTEREREHETSARQLRYLKNLRKPSWPGPIAVADAAFRGGFFCAGLLRARPVSRRAGVPVPGLEKRHWRLHQAAGEQGQCGAGVRVQRGPDGIPCRERRPQPPCTSRRVRRALSHVSLGAHLLLGLPGALHSELREHLRGHATPSGKAALVLPS